MTRTPAGQGPDSRARAGGRWRDSVRAALRPAPAPLALAPAGWALLAASAIALTGAATGRLDVVGMAYFGAACAAVLVSTGAYRTRAIALLCQGMGAAAGLGIGSLAAQSVVAKVAIAVVVAFVAGAIGAIGRMSTAFALMLVIGAAFGQFGRVPLPWWEQAGWYLVGSAAIGVAALLPWVVGRDRIERAAIADIYERAADLGEAIGSPTDAAVRLQLSVASAAGRAAARDYRLPPSARRIDGARRAERIRGALDAAEEAALEAARLYALGRQAPEAFTAAARHAGAALRRGVLPDAPAAPRPTPRQTGTIADSVLRAAANATTRAATMAGLRLALCMGIATAVTCAIHRQSHSFWLPLTVAVVVRPEYASVFVRTVNRGAGTVAGALIAAALLLGLHSGWPVALAAAAAMSLAMLVAPKLYAFSVMGITCSALLSACIGKADPAYPGIRALDTLGGCAIAIVFGYLLWPGRASLPDGIRLPDATRAAADYLRLAAAQPQERAQLAAARDRAYQLTHQSRAAAQAALLEPPPASSLARAALPAAVSLENLVDRITALAQGVERGEGAQDAASIGESIRAIDAASARAAAGGLSAP